MTGLLAYRRTLLVLAAGVAVVLAVLTFAVHDAKARILQALGPRATVGEITLSYPQVTLRDVRIVADSTQGAWPSAEEFHAALVVVRIDVGSLWAFRHGEPLVISDVRVDNGTLVMLRTRGHLTMLPALRETTRAKAQTMGESASGAAAVPVSARHGGPARIPAAVSAARSPDEHANPAAPPSGASALVLRHVHAERMAVDLFDATLPGAAPHRLRFEEIHGDVADIALPTLAQAIAVDVAGVLVGVERNGTVTVKGRFTPATHDADIALRGTNIDLVALQPYLMRLGEGTVRHGRLDMQLDARVAQRQLDAPGHLTLSGLEFGEGGGSTFAGAERRAVLAALSRNGEVDMSFTLVGRTDDPKFSLNESLATRIAAGMAQAVGVSVKGIVEGVGDALKGLLGGSGGR